jgi:hypothetical protein
VIAETYAEQAEIIEQIAERRRVVKGYAIERLLDWGFEPALIADILGCSPQLIAAIAENGAGGAADTFESQAHAAPLDGKEARRLGTGSVHRS